ncbi:class I SAM-dependent methyltransferase [Methanosarcina sp.]|uniref:class I SAM-dependent methyltransferase n=1 Tax=Methanosarcina sp. TaxID=2213 RepID=UPI0029899A9E|nr:class I SAM-dependent methyltransferase [Methanosarcina sp.]MDW5549181.1 class I SAM-dependent methyltransferase [Methanosarcina sp.]MDW5553113.1 class I SAM-dependent methyltransferase [Methanosarcina sp.]MDW5559361.1 class I SAM-dependent methyltransferase [Methanosarcina sp.]
MKLADKIIHSLYIKKGFKYYPEDKYLIENILKLSKKECPKILDVGCGSGHYSFLFDKYGAKVTAFDIDKFLIEKASEKKKEHNSNAVFLIADGRFPERRFSEKFDIIFMSGFSLFSTNLNKEIMEKYLSLLDSEGKLVFAHTTNLNGLVRETGPKNYRVEDVKKFFESSDCKIEKIYFYDRHVIIKILHYFVLNEFSTKMHILISKMTKLPCSLIFIVKFDSKL